MKISDKIRDVRQAFDKEIDNVATLVELEDIKNKYLSRKGIISKLFSGLSVLDSSNRPDAGNKLNILKKEVAENIESRANSIDSSSNISKNFIDLTLPGKKNNLGSQHPLSKVISKIESIFTRIGFSIAYGPEVDTDFFNFEALNIPKHHPARDMQDTFYLKDGNVLRTHTSNSQIHYMLDNKPPIRIIAPGRVYRNEDISVRSYCLFHQIEGLYVDKAVTFSELKGTLDYFARELFGKEVKTRFRPSYFPFTEPSAEMDVSCIFCKSQGGQYITCSIRTFCFRYY